MNLDMDRHIHEVAAVCDYVQGLQRSSKRLWLSFDEWNVWYRARERRGHRRPPHGRAAPARGGLQPRGRAARRRLRQHAAAQFGSRAGRLPGAARQRHRAARDQRERRAAPEHLLSLQLGAPLRARPRARSARRVGDLSDQRRRPAGRLRAQRRRAVRRPRRDARRARRPGRRADAQSRSRRRARGRARVGGRRARRACSRARR